MPTRRVLNSVLANFLGTYCSRYSDYRGYWLFGQLSFKTSCYEFDLFSQPATASTVSEFAHRLAALRFAEQLTKAGLAIATVKQATLRIQMLPESVQGWQGNRMSNGHMVQFSAAALADTGRQFMRQKSVFVAPHNPRKEFRRASDQWGSVPE